MAYANEGIDERAEVVLVNSAVNAPAINDTLTFWLKSAGSVVTPDASSAYVTIIDNGGATRVARTAATIASGGKLTYTRQWAEADFPLGEDYQALWEWTESSTAKADRQYFDCVRSKLPCLIDESDILEVLPNVLDHLPAIGLSDTLRFIRRAWSQILSRIRSGGNRPSLLLDRHRLVEPAIHLACAKACFALARDQDDIWWERFKQQNHEWTEAWKGLGELKYDTDENALASNEETARVNRVKFRV